METEKSYTVKITPEAERYYYKILEYLYKHHSEESANRKSEELLEQTLVLERSPFIGKKETNLRYLGKGHRYILYYYTNFKAIKIIYFVDESSNNVYVTDFFPCSSNPLKISSR